MSTPLNLAAALESALRLYLEQDPQATARCAALEGKVIGIRISAPELSLYFLPGHDGIQVLSHYEGDVDTLLHGSVPGFARMMTGSRENALFEGAVRIEGDTATGQQFQDLLSGVDWDWEEQLSQVTGDIIAHNVGSAVRNLGHFIRNTGSTLSADLSEYLQEEARLLPSRIEAEHFLSDVDELRSQTDRIAARVERLQQHMESEI